MKRSFTCQQCSIEKDSCLYGSKDIIRHTRQDTVCELVCLECTPSRARHLTKDSYTCTSCEKLLSVDAFSGSMQISGSGDASAVGAQHVHRAACANRRP
jgi:hypothetical protein